jgi:hypothetical protein
MSTKKNSTTIILTSAIFRRRIFGRTITKKTTSGSMIIENKGMEGPAVRETNGKMREKSVVADIEKMCTNMEMEMKDKNKSIVVHKLLSGTDSPFTRWVVDYRLLEKFKVPQIMSYARDGDPLDHLENF